MESSTLEGNRVAAAEPEVAFGATARSSDEILAQRLKGQIHGAYDLFDALVRRHKDRIVADCRYMTGSAEDAEDLAQDVFVKAFCGLWSFRGEAKFRSWLQRIKVNHCISYLRQRKSVPDTAVTSDVADMRDGRPNPEEQVIMRERLSNAHVALASLPETLRVPLVMCDMDGFSYKEIADRLGIGLSAAKMRIKRGREEFRRTVLALPTSGS